METREYTIFSYHVNGLVKYRAIETDSLSEIGKPYENPADGCIKLTDWFAKNETVEPDECGRIQVMGDTHWLDEYFDVSL
jgi:hypothetical protein